MFVLGHLGIGSKLVQPVMGGKGPAGLPRRWMLLGTLLPDLMDKPLYWGLVIFTHRQAPMLEWIRGTRAFGHTALFLLLLTLFAMLRRSKAAAALAIGVASHLLLDHISDHFVWNTGMAIRYSELVWPAFGWEFPSSPYKNLGAHAWHIFQPFLFGAELVGGSLLAWDYWIAKHRGEILKEGRLGPFKKLRTRLRLRPRPSTS